MAANESAVSDDRIANFENMVQYLQDQVKALEEENKKLRDQLAAKRDKVPLTPCTPQMKRLAEEDPPDFPGIAIELIRAREIHALPLPQVDADRSEVEKMILGWLSQNLPPGYGKAQGRAFAALGAIPEPVDTLALKAAFLSHQLAAWYDGKEESLHLVPTPEGARENALGLGYAELFRAHGEALFPADKASMTTDERIARECLLAGDSAFTRLLHSLKNPSQGGGGGVGEDPDDPSHAVLIPHFLRELALAPFNTGLEFVKTLHSIGEFPQLNAAYSRPPLTGAEIVDAGLFLAEDPPERPEIRWPEVSLNGEAPIWDDRFGVLCMVGILKQFVPDPVAYEAVSGWANDRCLVYASKDGGRDHAAWQTLWRDTNTADGFFAAMRQSLASRYKGSTPAMDAPKGVFKLSTTERHVILQRSHGGKGVLYIDAADAATAEALAGRLSLK